jgi:integrase
MATGIKRQGQWLAQVLRGWLAYYAVPMSGSAITAFRHHMIERWMRVLQRRSQRTRRSLSWGRMKRSCRNNSWPLRRCSSAENDSRRGTDTRTQQAYLGHKNIQHTARYTELAPTRFRNLWTD